MGRNIETSNFLLSLRLDFCIPSSTILFFFSLRPSPTFGVLLRSLKKAKKVRKKNGPVFYFFFKGSTVCFAHKKLVPPFFVFCFPFFFEEYYNKKNSYMWRATHTNLIFIESLTNIFEVFKNKIWPRRRILIFVGKQKSEKNMTVNSPIPPFSHLCTMLNKNKCLTGNTRVV